MKISIEKTECTLDENKEICITEDDKYLCSVTKNSKSINSTIENNTATIIDDDLYENDTVEAWCWYLWG